MYSTEKLVSSNAKHTQMTITTERISYGCISSQIIKEGTVTRQAATGVQAIQANQALKQGEVC